MPQQVNVYRELKMFPGAIVTGSWNGAFDRGGDTFYVNNITGNSTADGLSWNSAVAQPSQAITLSEASRLIHPGTTTNDYIMNTIVVQGTGTAYSAISALPSYARIIGLGGPPRANGTGIVVIDGAGSASAMAGAARGMELYNIQAGQSSAGNYYGLDTTVLYRSRIEGCAFVNNAYGGIHITNGGGVIMNDVHCGHDTLAQAYGLKVSTGTTFNACLITNSDFAGDDAGVYLQVNGGGKETYFKDCFAMGGTSGFEDTIPSDAGNMPFYIRCYGFGTTAGFALTHISTVRSIGCIDNSNGTVNNYPDIAND